MKDFEQDNFYAEEHRYELLEDDEMSSAEEAFMAGYEEAL